MYINLFVGHRVVIMPPVMANENEVRGWPSWLAINDKQYTPFGKAITLFIVLIHFDVRSFVIHHIKYDSTGLHPIIFNNKYENMIIHELVSF